MITLKYLARFLTFMGTALFALILTMLTIKAGRGQCPECGYRGDLHKCKHCGWTACLACWQRMGKYTCPECGRGNP